MDEPFGRYRLREKIGEGGMGQVFRAYDTGTDRVVAVKVLPEHLSTNDEYRERFRREAHAAARLREPHIVPIHDFGDIGGRLFLDMRLIDGTDLSRVVGRDGPLSPDVAVGIVEQIAAALDAAHAEGLVHRDVKPSNILLAERGFAYLIDFGIARAATDSSLTGTGNTLGTVAYMAPERFTAGHADQRADVYALACVLHELLTGATPFPGHSLEQQIAAHLTTPPPRPGAFAPRLSPFDEIIAHGMHKDPGQRYSTAGELAHAAGVAREHVVAAPTQADVGVPSAGEKQGAAKFSRFAATEVAPGGGTQGAANFSRTAVTEIASGVSHTPLPVSSSGPESPQGSPLGVQAAGSASPSAPVADKRLAAPPPASTPVVVGFGAFGVGAIDAIDTPTDATAGDSGVVDAPKPSGGLMIAGALLAMGLAVAVAIVATNASSGAKSREVVAQTITMDTGADEVAVDPAANALYVASADEGMISVIDLETRKVVSTIPVAGKPGDIVVDATTRTLYVSEQDAVLVIDIGTRTVTGRVPVPAQRLVLDPGSQRLYVLYSDTVSIIDTHTRAVRATLGGDYRYDPAAALDPAAHTLYVNGDGGEIAVLDTNHETPSDAIVLGENTSPLAVAVNPDDHLLYVTTMALTTSDSGDERFLSIIDPASGKELASIPAKGNALDLAVDPGGHTAYLVNFDNVQLVDTRTRAEVDKVEYPFLQGSAQDIAVDTANHTAYIAMGSSNTISVVSRSE
ncbi:serine/threonine-protein kinase [Nocardia callitridis]|uniref:non-specific serine/threonine protein kinase n=1 Tax=Nocardia callitridis TaxID=648753 RepID=A0ABP9KDL9_9NOCA